MWGLGKTTGIGKCNLLKSFRLGFMPLHGKEIASHLDVLEKLGCYSPSSSEMLVSTGAHLTSLYSASGVGMNVATAN